MKKKNHLRYDASGLLTPDTGNKEKNWANMMIGLMDACKLSVFGLNELAENATGSDTENLNEILRQLKQAIRIYFILAD